MNKSTAQKKRMRTAPAASAKNPSRSKLLKVTSIIIVMIFIVIIGLDLIRESYTESKAIPPTAVQLDAARALIAQALQQSGDNITHYNTTFSKKLTLANEENHPILILRACLANDTTTHRYIIDMNATTILVHTATEIYRNTTAHYDARESCRSD